MALETVVVTVVDDQVVPQPVDGVVVRVFDAAGATFVTSGTTGAHGPGSVEFTLNGEDPGEMYTLRFFRFGFSTTSPQAVEIFSPPASSPTGTNTFQVQGSVRDLPEATDPDACRVSGFIYDGGVRPRQGIDMHFIPQFSPLKVGERGVLGERVTHRTDKDGYLQIDLWRNGCYQVVLESHENVVRYITVPNRSSINVMDLLFPVVTAIEFAPAGPYALNVDDLLVITPSVTSSDYRVLCRTADGDVKYEIEDPSVAALTYDAETLTIRGVSPGTTTLTAVRRDQSILRLPLTEISGAPVSIVVS